MSVRSKILFATNLLNSCNLVNFKGYCKDLMYNQYIEFSNPKNYLFSGNLIRNFKDKFS